jgi:hypothetical protein
MMNGLMKRKAAREALTNESLFVVYASLAAATRPADQVSSRRVTG